MTRHSPRNHIGPRRRPEHRSRRRHFVKRDIPVLAIFLRLDPGLPLFRTLLDPRHEVEHHSADKNANPEAKFGSVYDHPQDIDAAFTY